MLHLHRAERADRLVHALAGVLATPPPDPLATECVAVHSRGIERWLAQELSTRLGARPGHRDGICANVEFPFPGRVVGRALAAAGELPADADPWAPERLVWPLLEVVDARLDEEWLAPLRAHLRPPHLRPPTQEADPGPPHAPGSRRFATARRIAGLFDRYAVHRPSMVRAWAQGRDVDGDGAPLGAEAAWQPALWRQARAHIGVASPAERLDQAVARLKAGLAVDELPARLALFGVTALPISYVTVLRALAAVHEVHLFLLHPSAALWAEVAGRPAASGSLPRHRDPTREFARHPLLASWGRDAREMQLVAGGEHDERAYPLPEEAASGLLARLQADVRANTAPPGPPLDAADPDERPLLDDGDRSVQVHACHGRTRQVEVARDAILHLLADDPTLEPRDVVVMCPDVETFAPLVRAVFGEQAVASDRDADPGGEAGLADDDVDAHADAGSAGLTPASHAPPEPEPVPTGAVPALRVRLADRALRQTNPVLRVIADLLGLADGRLTASEVVDLATHEPVRRRFGFDDEDLERIERWIADAGVRWGLDERHRASFGLDGVAANTWRSGLDRLLVGLTMADEDLRTVDGTVPLDDAEGTDADLAGRLAEYVDRLGAAVDALGRATTVESWRDAISNTAAWLTATPDGDQPRQLARLLDDVVAEATRDGAASQAPLTLPEARALLEDRLRGRPTRANHRTGDMTVCTLVPMRAVPHRVVCVLGMDDGSFPRRTTVDGDDLVDREPHVGDRDPRTEDRQLLLDALLAAGDTFVVTYTGRDECTNERRPPSVATAELLDVIDRTARTADATPAGSRVRVEHPLQPFDPRNFRAGALVPARPWGFDRTALAGARAQASGADGAGDGARPLAPLLPRPLPPLDRATVDLDALVGFLRHPVRAFVRDRLGVDAARRDEDPDDAIPLALDPLARHDLGARLLTARLGGADVQRWAAVERARGTLPPGTLADAPLGEVVDTVAAIEAVAGECADLAARTSREVDVILPGGVTVLGTVADLAGDTLLTVAYARVGPRHRLAAWARLLALTATDPDRPWRAVVVGRSPRPGARARRCDLGPLGDTPTARAEHARTQLARLVELYDRGMREPLPLACATSAAYAEAVHEGANQPEVQARKEWTTSPPGGFPKEDRDEAHALLFGPDRAFEDMLAEPAAADETGDGWAEEETSRFARLARRVWDPLLAAEHPAADR